MSAARDARTAAALDRFDVPAASAGFAKRIMAATGGPFDVAPPLVDRDRRGRWRRVTGRRGRNFVIGSLAVALLSAGAVASGMLGHVGIRVPVLSAMLARAPSPVAKPVAVRPGNAHFVAPKPLLVPAPVIELPAAPLLDTPQPLARTALMAERQARRARIAAFAEAHPVIAASVRQRVREHLLARAEARLEALQGPVVGLTLPGGDALTPEQRRFLIRAARRDRLRMEAMIDRRIAVREARRADQSQSQAESQSQSQASPATPGAATDPADVQRNPPSRTPDAASTPATPTPGTSPPS